MTDVARERLTRLMAEVDELEESVDEIALVPESDAEEL